MWEGEIVIWMRKNWKLLIVGEEKKWEFLDRLRKIGIWMVKLDMERMWVYLKKKIELIEGMVREKGEKYKMKGKMRCYGKWRREEIGIIIDKILK